VILNRQTLFLVYLYFGLLFPNFYGILNTRGAILVNLLLMIFPILYLIVTRKANLQLPFNNCLAFRNYIKIPLYFILSIPTAMFLGLWFLDNNLIIRDFFELHRPVYWLIIFVTSYFFFAQNFHEPSIRRVIISIFLICAIMGVFQFLKFNFPFYNLYIKENNFLARRITAPFPNPYDYGFVMLFMATYFMSMYINTRKMIYLIFVTVSAILIALTQSRSMLFSFILTNILILPFFASLHFGSIFRGRISRVDIIVILIPILLMAFGFTAIQSFQDNFKYLINGIAKIMVNPIYNGVTDNRIDQLSFILSKISTNPILMLFGNGPAKGEMDDVESIYSYFLFRYGVVGLIVGFLFPAFYSSYCSKLIAKTYARGSYNYVFFRFLQLWFLVVPVISLGNNHTEQLRVSFLYTLLLGLVAARMDASGPTK
jgi:hypothetical protein